MQEPVQPVPATGDGVVMGMGTFQVIFYQLRWPNLLPGDMPCS